MNQEILPLVLDAVDRGLTIHFYESRDAQCFGWAWGVEARLPSANGKLSGQVLGYISPKDRLAYEKLIEERKQQLAAKRTAVKAPETAWPSALEHRLAVLRADWRSMTTEGVDDALAQLHRLVKERM